MSTNSSDRNNITTLYRAVSQAEYQQLIAKNIFEIVNQSVEGKYFAEHIEHAAKWGDIFYGSGHYRIIEVEFPTTVADEFYRWKLLDGIGPARFAELEQLSNVNYIIRGVR